jgi:ATP/ADP translocase
MGLILLVILVLLLIGTLPTWNYSRRWGYRPVGIIGPILVIVLILVLMGYVPRNF